MQRNVLAFENAMARFGGADRQAPRRGSMAAFAIGEGWQRRSCHPVNLMASANFRPCTGRAESQETTAIKMVWGRAWGKSKKASNTLVFNGQERSGWDLNPRYGYPYNGFRDRGPSSDRYWWYGQFSVVAGPGFGRIFGSVPVIGIRFAVTRFMFPDRQQIFPALVTREFCW